MRHSYKRPKVFIQTSDKSYMDGQNRIIDTFVTRAGITHRLLERKGKIIWQEKDPDDFKPRFRVVISVSGNVMPAYWHFKTKEEK